MSIRSFPPDDPPARVGDLKARLRATRWPQPVTQDTSLGQAVPLLPQFAARGA